MQASYAGSFAPTVPFVAPHNRRPPSVGGNLPQALVETVYLIDQDRFAQAELAGLLASLDLNLICFANASEYLGFVRRDAAACLILNKDQPDVDSLELQRKLADGTHPPIIFISGYCDTRCVVGAIKAGAVEFLTRPIDQAALIGAIRAALVQDRKLRQRKAELAKLQQRLSLLTPREGQVLPLIVGGLLNKQAASLLGISEVTLQIHRSQVMRKMQADSFADLVRMAVKLRIQHWREVPRDETPASGFPLYTGRSSNMRQVAVLR